MDNKKWYNRFATIFWWSLTILPLIIALIYFIGYHLTFNSGITSASELANYHSNSEGDFGNYLYFIFEDFFSNFSISYLCDMFDSLSDSINIGNTTLFGWLFGYMVSVQFYHLLFDFIIWLPRFFHSILEKGFDKLS